MADDFVKFAGRWLGAELSDWQLKLLEMIKSGQAVHIRLPRRTETSYVAIEMAKTFPTVIIVCPTEVSKKLYIERGAPPKQVKTVEELRDAG